MSDEYCYPDARLSIWQASVREVQLKYNQPAGKMANASLTTEPRKSVSADQLMRPVHFVARTVRDAGKPFEFLAHEVRNGILDLRRHPKTISHLG